MYKDLLLTRSRDHAAAGDQDCRGLYAQKKQRVEDQSDSTQAAPASQRSGTSQQPRTPASAFARTHTFMPAQRQLTLSGSLLSQRQLTLPSMAIAERHNKANLQLGMLFYGCGIPFNVSCSHLFKRALQSVAETGPGFKPVFYDALRGRMLDKVRYGHTSTAEPCFWRSQATGEVRKERLRSL